MMRVQAVWRGLPDLKAALKDVPVKMRTRIVRNALAFAARIVRDEARRHTPIISASSRSVQRGWRKPGTVRRAISVRTSKQARRDGNVGVFVNVRPAKGSHTTSVKALGVRFKVRAASSRGAKNPADPYYWRFIEFGTARGTSARKFLQRATSKLGDVLIAFANRVAPEIQRLNRRKP